jgi:hypothetical protein
MQLRTLSPRNIRTATLQEIVSYSFCQATCSIHTHWILLGAQDSWIMSAVCFLFCVWTGKRWNFAVFTTWQCICHNVGLFVCAVTCKFSENEIWIWEVTTQLCNIKNNMQPIDIGFSSSMNVSYSDVLQ